MTAPGAASRLDARAADRGSGERDAHLDAVGSGPQHLVRLVPLDGRAEAVARVVGPLVADVHRGCGGGRSRGAAVEGRATGERDDAGGEEGHEGSTHGDLLAMSGRQRDVGECSKRRTDEVRGGDREHRVGRAASGINNVVVQQIPVDQRREGRRMPERRNAADRKPRGRADERRIGLADRLADERGHLRLVHAVGAARDDQHRAPARRTEHERLRDLARPRSRAPRAACAEVRAALGYSTIVAATPAASSACWTREAAGERLCGGTSLT